MKYVILMFALVFSWNLSSAVSECVKGKHTCSAWQDVVDQEFKLCQDKEAMAKSVKEREEAIKGYYDSCMFGHVKSQSQQSATTACWACPSDAKPHLISSYDRVDDSNNSSRNGGVNEFGLIPEKYCSTIHCAPGRKVFGAQIIGDTAWGSKKWLDKVSGLPLTKTRDGEGERNVIDVDKLSSFTTRDGTVISIEMQSNDGERASERVLDACISNKGRLKDEEGGNVDSDRTAVCQELCKSWYSDGADIQVKAREIEDIIGTVNFNSWLAAHDSVKKVYDEFRSARGMTGSLSSLNAIALKICGPRGGCTEYAAGSKEFKECECAQKGANFAFVDGNCIPTGEGPDKPTPSSPISPTYSSGDDEEEAVATATGDSSLSSDTGSGSATSSMSDILASGSGISSGSKKASKDGKGSTSGLLSMNTPATGGGSGGSGSGGAMTYGSGRGGASGAYGSGTAGEDNIGEKKEKEIVDQDDDAFKIVSRILNTRYVAGLFDQKTASSATVRTKTTKRIGTKPTTYRKVRTGAK